MAVKYLTGKIKWHRNKEVDKYKKRTLNLYMSDDMWQKYNSLELGLKTRDDPETGEKFVTLNRKETGYGAKGATFDLGPWEVINKDGTPYDGEVWNGSDVTVKVDVYFSKNSGLNVARVEAVRVDNLAEGIAREADEVIDSPF